MDSRGTIEEQEEQGLRRPTTRNFVPPAIIEQPTHRGTVTRMETTDPYAGKSDQTVHAVIHYNSDPISRADASIKRSLLPGITMAFATGAAMYAFSLYPPTLGSLGIFMLWLFFALTEVLGMYFFIAWLDYYEQPASIAHEQAKTAKDLMKTEQRARLFSQHKLTNEEFDKVTKGKK